MSIVTGLLLLSSLRAWASPCDLDLDGYQHSGGACTPPANAVDCNDDIIAGPAINPNKAEITGDGTDQDCNGADASQQRLKSDMTSTGWTSSGPVLWTGDAASLHPGSSVTKLGPWVYAKGRTHVLLDVDSASAGCTLSVTNSAIPGPARTMSMAIPTGSGTRDFHFGTQANYVAAPRTLNSIQVACATGNAIIDFLTVQDGSDVLPPAEDITIDWEDMNTPGGGYETTAVRSDYLGTKYWMASDVAGVALEIAPGSYQQANGNGQDRSSGISSTLSSTSFPCRKRRWPSRRQACSRRTMTGSPGTMPRTAGRTATRGRRTTPGMWRTSAWMVVRRCAMTAPTAGGGTRWRTSLEGGDISAFLASTAPGAAGVYTRGPGAAGVATYGPLASDLPARPNAYIGALEYLTPTDGGPTLVIGYRGDDATLPSLYTCDVSGTPAVCDPVAGSEGLDIRDIQVDESDPYQETFFVANGGWTVDAGVCVEGFSTVEEVLFDPSSGWGFSTTVADTQYASSSWVTETDKGGITGLTMDPGGSYLFAVVFGGSGAAYEAATQSGLFRIAAGDIGTGAWQDLTDTTESDRDVRTAAVTNSDWFGEDQSAGVHARPYVGDQTAADFVDGSWEDGDTLLLSGQGNVQRVTGMLDTGAFFPFDPENDTSWDFLPAAGISDLGDFQTSVPNEVAIDANGGFWQSTLDLGLFHAAPGYAPGLDCIFQDTLDGGLGVSAASDGSVWFAAGDQSGDASGAHSAVFRTTGSVDQAGDLEWCYQSAAYIYGDWGNGLPENYGGVC